MDVISLLSEPFSGFFQNAFFRFGFRIICRQDRKLEGYLSPVVSLSYVEFHICHAVLWLGYHLSAFPSSFIFLLNSFFVLCRSFAFTAIPISSSLLHSFFVSGWSEQNLSKHSHLHTGKNSTQSVMFLLFCQLFLIMVLVSLESFAFQHIAHPGFDISLTISR